MDKNEILMIYGKNYKEMTKELLTAAKLAEQIGISQYTLSRKFLGKNPFLYDEVVQICEMLKIDNPIPYFPKTRK